VVVAEVSDEHEPGADADTNMKRRHHPGGDARHNVHDAEAGPHGLLSVVLMCLGKAKIGQNAAPRESRHHTAETDDHLGAAAVKCGKNLLQIFRIERR
jgi:hypothetical protein